MYVHFNSFNIIYFYLQNVLTLALYAYETNY